MTIAGKGSTWNVAFIAVLACAQLVSTPSVSDAADDTTRSQRVARECNPGGAPTDWPRAPDDSKIEIKDTTIVGNVDLSVLAKRAVLSIGRQLPDSVRLPAIGIVTDDLSLLEAEKNAATALQALDIVNREVVFNNVVIKGDLIIGTERDVKSSNSVLVFTRGISILNTIVCGNFHLYGSRMLQGANFADTHLGQSAQIGNALALRSVIFKNASVSNTLRITNSIFQGMLDLSCVTSVDGPKHNRVGLHLDGNIFRRQFDLGARNCQYETYELATLSITGSEFTKGPVNLTNLVVADRLQITGSIFHHKLDLRDVSSGEFASFANSTFHQGVAILADAGRVWGEVSFVRSVVAGQGLELSRMTARALHLTRAQFTAPVHLSEVQVQFLNARNVWAADRFSLHLSRVGAATLADSHFAKSVTIRENIFGGVDKWFCPGAAVGKRIVFDASQATFAEGLDLSASALHGRIRLRSISVAPSKLVFAWDQVRGRIDTGDTGPEFGNCITGIREPDFQGRFDANLHERVLSLVEESLRSAGDIPGANEAFFFKQRIAAYGDPASLYYLHQPGFADLTSDYAGACLRARFLDCLWGHSVRPLRVGFALTGLWIALACCLCWSKVQLAGSREPKLGWSTRRLPIFAAAAEGQSSASPSTLKDRTAGYMFVSLQTVTGLQLFDVTVKTGGRPWIRGLLLISKAAAVVLAFFGVVAIGQVVPLLSKVLGFIVK